MAYGDARAEREFNQNPPASAPGQDQWDDWDSIPEGSSSAEDLSQSSAINNNIGDTLNNSSTTQNSQAQVNPPKDLKSYTSTEDAVIDATKKVATGVYGYVKLLVKSLSNNTKGDWHDLGVRICQCSAGTCIVGIIFTLIDLFRRSGNTPIDLVIGGLLSMMVGIFFCMSFDKDTSTKEEVVEEEPNYAEEEEYEPSGGNYNFEWDEEDEEDEDFESEDSEDDYLDDDDDDSAWAALLNDSNLFEEENNTNSIDSENFSVESAMDGVSDITPGTQTRQYLFETFMKVLPIITPDYAKMTNIPDTSDTFYMFYDYLRQAAYQVGTKEENIPELNSVYENPFIYRLNCSRPVGLKEQQIADEIASTYSRDDNNMLVRVGVYATIETSINVYTINLFKGMLADPQLQKPITISLGDVYREKKSFITDSNVEMPFVWGVSELGSTWYCDLIDVNSLIISGEPRGGKSWKGQSIIAQLAMFNSPKDIEFYFFDTKNTASDYRHLSEVLPHAKYFCGDPMKVNDGIQRVLDKAVEERGKIITDSGCINIKDYNKKFPDHKLPYMYVVIDELMGLMNFFETNDLKDEASRFKGFLSMMVSKLAYTGVRFILFPHRIVDSVIGKNTYSLVSCRAVVNQLSEEELKSAAGVTKKAFPYLLAQKGDMAVKSKDINGGNTVFCHAEILSTSNSANEKLFDFIGSVWKRLEPDCKCIEFHGAIGGNVTINRVVNGETVYKGTSKPVDNTEGVESYKYEGYSEVSDLDTSELDDNPVDESFWEDFINS